MNESRKRFPARGLRRFHAILVGCGSGFAFAFSAYLLLTEPGRHRGDGPRSLAILLALLFAAGGVGLLVYLRGFLRRTSED